MRRHLHVLLVVATLFVFHKAEEKVSYEGYKLMRLYPTTREHVELISQFEAKDPSVRLNLYISAFIIDKLFFRGSKFNRNM